MEQNKITRRTFIAASGAIMLGYAVSRIPGCTEETKKELILLPQSVQEYMNNSKTSSLKFSEKNLQEIVEDFDNFQANCISDNVLNNKIPDQNVIADEVVKVLSCLVDYKKIKNNHSFPFFGENMFFGTSLYAFANLNYDKKETYWPYWILRKTLFRGELGYNINSHKISADTVFLGNSFLPKTEAMIMKLAIEKSTGILVGHAYVDGDATKCVFIDPYIYLNEISASQTLKEKPSEKDSLVDLYGKKIYLQEIDLISKIYFLATNEKPEFSVKNYRNKMRKLYLEGISIHEIFHSYLYKSKIKKTLVEDSAQDEIPAFYAAMAVGEPKLVILRNLLVFRNQDNEYGRAYFQMMKEFGRIMGINKKIINTKDADYVAEQLLNVNDDKISEMAKNILEEKVFKQL